MTTRKAWFYFLLLYLAFILIFNELEEYKSFAGLALVGVFTAIVVLQGRVEKLQSKIDQLEGQKEWDNNIYAQARTAEREAEKELKKVFDK